jgi:2-iminobutanoate/2-iminopropanoate deaminase
MKREIIRVGPLSTYLERWKAPTSAVTRHEDTIYVSGFPPFDPVTGEVVKDGTILARAPSRWLYSGTRAA